MTTNTTRRNRPMSDDAVLVMLGGRVSPETRKQARAAAAELALPMAVYLEQLVTYDAEHRVVRPPVQEAEAVRLPT